MTDYLATVLDPQGGTHYLCFRALDYLEAVQLVRRRMLPEYRLLSLREA